MDYDGEALTIDKIQQISYRSSPLSIGIVGKADAGKTTFLAMLFTLLQKGKLFENYSFCGSKTLIGWDQLYHHLKVYQGSIQFPDPTPTGLLRVYHLALRAPKGALRDLLIYEASGETFYSWSRNRDDENAENARTIYRKANAFALFIDCADLAERKGLARAEIIGIAEMLRHKLDGRPVVAVWSKADRMSEVVPELKNAISDELKDMFGKIEEIEISNLSVTDPDILVHQNNVQLIDKLLEQMEQLKAPAPSLTNPNEALYNFLP
ncbi:MAG: hypothetical protein EOP06_18170 [Proteobacteria bacterium]|nr:MAG: hypothetical protein EOP06_18170 [Pseudomonadota bacterium]